MNIVSSYEHLIDLLKHSFQNGTQGNSNARVAGILFAQPNNFTRDEILSSIEYNHYRSGADIDFFCIGYQPHFYDKQYPIITRVKGEDWSFNPEIFNTLRKETEQKTKWKYSGSVELVLFNSYLERDQVELDFADAVSIDLMKAKDDKLISSVGEVFEKIFSIAESISTENPSREMSLKLIGNTGKKSVVNILFNLLPKAIQDDTRRIYLYGTSNYRS